MATKERKVDKDIKKCEHYALKHSKKNDTIRCMDCKKFWINPFSEKWMDEYFHPSSD
jgi:hypothetical protein